jgi:hypothetical protein
VLSKNITVEKIWEICRPMGRRDESSKELVYALPVLKSFCWLQQHSMLSSRNLLIQNNING